MSEKADIALAEAQPIGIISALDVEAALEVKLQTTAQVLIEREPTFADHGGYLETFHEITIHVLADIDLLLAKGDTQAAKDLITRLRAKQDDMWEVTKEAASRLVAP